MNVSTEEAVNIGSSNLLHRPKRLRRNSLLKNHLVDRINLCLFRNLFFIKLMAKG